MAQPLHIACNDLIRTVRLGEGSKFIKPSVVQALLAAGARLDIPNNSNRLPFDTDPRVAQKVPDILREVEQEIAKKEELNPRP